ncbi:hypothetical protein DFO57_101562 [Pantoea sp. AG702]|nr:hypothetical protein DFO57_101562 [Pantoea sp. AG702]CCF11871.1 hypothetical protein PANA5342_pPANA10140 [Pantoea ananatis LMG 5342]
MVMEMVMDKKEAARRWSLGAAMFRSRAWLKCHLTGLKRGRAGKVRHCRLIDYRVGEKTVSLKVSQVCFSPSDWDIRQ